MSTKHIVEFINDKQAVEFLEDIIIRIKNKPMNASGKGWQVGGAYWRACHVLKFLDNQLDENETEEQAKFIRKNHGVIKK